ncbi:MAG: prepilin-type N-terminal cleavage/methylation domain-containing protein, partial [Akkermansia sp.]|nr:prepilin-type N-terminal cleavage/methylation domain-containing protein [Akkermansia sp.]
MKNFTKTIRRGFTLIELMTAMAITAILVLVIMQMTTKGIDIWRLVQEDISTGSRARIAMDCISHDFESMQMRIGDNRYEWLFGRAAKEVQGLDKDMKIPRSAQCVFFTSTVDRNPTVSSSPSLRRSYRDTRAHTSETQGDVLCVGYRLLYRDQVLNLPATKESRGEQMFPRFSLYRHLVPPRTTFERLLGTLNLKTAYAPYEAEDEKHFLCEDIVEFNVTFTIRHSMGKGDPERGYPNYETTSVPVISSTGKEKEIEVFGDRIEVDGQILYNPVIDSVNISMTVLTEEGANII